MHHRVRDACIFGSNAWLCRCIRTLWHSLTRRQRGPIVAVAILGSRRRRRSTARESVHKPVMTVEQLDGGPLLADGISMAPGGNRPRITAGSRSRAFVAAWLVSRRRLPAAVFDTCACEYTYMPCRTAGDGTGAHKRHELHAFALVMDECCAELDREWLGRVRRLATAHDIERMY